MATKKVTVGPLDSRNVDITQTQLPNWVNQGSEGLWNAAVGTANRGYEGYTGPRIADFNQDQQAAFAGVRNLAGGATDESMKQAKSMFEEGSQGWEGPVPTAERIDVADMGPIDDVTAERTSTAGWSPEAFETYRNPWDSAVTEATNAEIMRNAEIARRNVGASAGPGAAFGGSRHGIAEAENYRNALRTVADATASNQQRGFENAQGMFTSDEGRKLQSATGNANRALTAGQGNQQTAYNVGKTNIDKNLTQGRYNQEASMFDVGNRLDQFNTDQDRRLTGGRDIQNLTGQWYDQASDANKQLLGVGNIIEDKQQGGLDMAYQDFLDQRDYDRGQIDWLSDLLPKLPTDTTTVGDTTTPPATIGATSGGGPSTAGQIIGGLASAASMLAGV